MTGQQKRKVKIVCYGFFFAFLNHSGPPAVAAGAGLTCRIIEGLYGCFVFT